MGQDGCIILDRSRNSRAFDENESLWEIEVNRILDRLEEHRASLRATRELAAPDELPFLSIAIFGPSGSGKSSLLRTLVRLVNTTKSGHDRQDVIDSVHSLPVMQPDRFAEHDHFLYAFLATALKEEKDERDKRDRRDEESIRRREQRYEPDALSPVQQRFQELSDFLRVIDEPEKSRDYDPLGLSLERLERHTSALLLKDRMKSFIDSLADALAGRSASGQDDSIVLLPVDDADMSPQHLVTSLKIYQTYLLHARLVPVFTFTDRTAEELLRGYFHRHLFTVPDGTNGAASVPMVYASPGEGTRRLPVGDQLALQYLARCFPVRNRIRLGPAPARFRAKHYSISEGERKKDRADQRLVKSLLETASQLLYGVVGREARHQIRAALRPSTLRRQFHVVDEMVAAKVEDYVPGTGTSDDKRKRWVQVFDRAAWALMNVHRDVLREYDLYLEDLYSWTPQGLRRLLLETILSQPIEARRALLHRWRFRLSSRRAETLSLLAANVFRPWIPGEEPSGDDWVMRVYKDKFLTEHVVLEGDKALPASTALLWFLDLLNGFYQPQVLAWNRPNDIAVSNPDKGRVVGLGWNLENGPVNAVRAAEANDSVATAGMLFLDPFKYSDALKWGAASRESHQESALFLRCWTYCGYSRGRYWAAVSFWRGLSLIGQLLRARRQVELSVLAEKVDPRNSQAKGEGENSDRPEGNDSGSASEGYETASGQRIHLNADAQKRLRERLRGILRNHLIRGLVPGQLVGEGEREGRLDLAFRRWDLTPTGRGLEGDGATELEKKLLNWVLNLDRLPESSDQEGLDRVPRALLAIDEMIELMPDVDLKMAPNVAWKRSLLRRLHGDDIVGSLLSRLNATFIDDTELRVAEVRFEGDKGSLDRGGPKDPTESRYRWNAGIAMTTWTRIFLDYWRGLKPMQDLLRSCPLLAPFAEGPMTDRFRNHTIRALLSRDSPESILCDETVKARLTECPDLWGGGLEKAKLSGASGKSGKSGDPWEKLSKRIEDHLKKRQETEKATKDWLKSWKNLKKELLWGEDSKDQVERFLHRLGFCEVHIRPRVLGGSARGHAAETERRQINAFMNAIAGVSLFYALPRVRPWQFQPSQPIAAVRPHIEIDSPVEVSATVQVAEPIAVKRVEGQRPESLPVQPESSDEAGSGEVPPGVPP